MAYHDVNSEGLTFSEWVQAAGRYVANPMGDDYGCAPYTWGSHSMFPRALRDAWRNGEDPTEHRAAAPGRRFD